MVAGVAGGLADRLGVDPVLVRIGFVVMTFAGGTGVIVYGALWALTPVGRPSPHHRSRPPTLQQSAALALIALGVLLLLRQAGLWFGDALVFPVVLAAAGSAVVWTRGDERDRDRWSRSAERVPRSAISAAAAGPASPVRVIVGTLLVAGAVAGFVAGTEGLAALRDVGLALIAAVGGVALLFGPWLWRLGEQLTTERRERIRQEERAELAAHLHDSVLQTLALIQRSADQPRRMVALARRQERELRSWLYGADGLGGAANLSDAVEAVAEEVEAVHDLNVEVVVVGDAPLDERVAALLAATREACVNAAKHAGVSSVVVYVEVEANEVLAFIRDRGRGFDPERVPADRHGIRDSMVARLARHDGRARVLSAPGEGTEVELCVPRRRAAAPGAAQASDAPASPDAPAPSSAADPEVRP